MKVYSLLPAAAVALFALSTLPAQAQNARSFVSGHGSDSAACTLPAPCRTLAQALTRTNASGEIVILDPAGYGSLTINKAITITNDGVGTAGVIAPANGVGIAINAGPSDAISLRGLTVEGGGVAYNGIVLTSGGSLTVDNCVVLNFHNTGDALTGQGIYIAPTSGTVTFAVTNTISSNNGYGGVSIFPTGSGGVTGVIEHLTAIANQYYGVATDSHSSGAVIVAVANSVTSNAYSGIFSGNYGSGTFKASIDNVTSSGNQRGVEADGTAKVVLGRSTIVSNAEFGLLNSTSPNTFYSYQNNQVYLNATDVGLTAPLTATFH